MVFIFLHHIKAKKAHMDNTKVKLRGSAKRLHWAKEMAGAAGKVILNTVTKTRLVPVPTIVAIPPREEQNATPNNMHTT